MTTLVNALRQLFRDIRSQKLRTLLTTLGIVWGTVAVSLLLAFGNSFHKQMVQNAAGIGSGIVIGWPSQTSLPFEGLGKGRRVRMNEDDIRLIKSRATLLGQISSEYADNLTLQIGPRRLAVDVSGVLPAYGEMRNIIPRKGGRFLNPIDERLSRRVAFLGDEIAEQLFGGGDPVGKLFRLHGSPFVVVGVMQRKIQQSSYSGRDKDKVVIPASTFKALTGREYLNNFIYTAADVENTAALNAQVLETIAAKHRFDPEDREALSIWDTTEFAQFFEVFMLAFRTFLLIVGGLILLVGAIGVSNIMNVVVEERTPEVGIKMALGAKPRGILGQFLLESLIVTALGGALGLAIAHAICTVFPAFGTSDFVGNPTISPGVALVTAGILGVLGTLAGFFPAQKAANLDPVVSMKM